MSKTHYFIIQLHAVLSIMGYWCMHSILTAVVGETSSIASIAYDGLQLIVSLHVMMICKKDFMIERGRTMLSFYSIILILYSLRMVFDMLIGPFTSQVSMGMFLNDIFLTVFHTFTAVWAMITSRRYLDINTIVRILFIMSLVTVVFIIITYSKGTLDYDYEEQRISGGRGLNSLALAKIGAITVLSAIHLLLNDRKKKQKPLYIVGVILGLWLALASGSRGALVALIIALAIYWVFASRRNVLLLIPALVAIVLILIYLVPILFWLSDYFPVVGQRMLATIIEDDQSGRQELRIQAIKLILDNPVFGYSYRLNPTETGYGPHNGILSIFLALGVPIGLLFIVFAYIKPIIIAIKIMPRRDTFLATTMCVLFLVNSMSGSSITEPCFGFSICLLASIYYYKTNNDVYSSNIQPYVNELFKS